MKKKILSAALIALLLLSMLPATALAASYGDFEYNVSNNEITITGYLGTAAELTIPSEIEGLPVTIIRGYAFSGCSGLTSVTIPNSVTTIGALAFYNCDGLTSVTIPNSVTTIGMGAFYGCSGLTSVTIPNSVTAIGDYAFSGCTRLTSVTIPNSVTTIGAWAFYNCDGLTSVTIPNSVTTIGNQAFSDCSGLTSVTIPGSVTTIEEYAFSDCTGLTSVTIPNSVTTIGSCAFNGCSGLTSVTIPNSVTTIGNDAFGGCSGLTSVTIPNSVTTIEFSAFSFCTGLTSVTIPNSVTTIGGWAFVGCSGLTSVTIPNSVTTIGGWAFADCSGLTDVYYTGSEQDWTDIKIESENDCLTSANIHYNYVMSTDDGDIVDSSKKFTDVEEGRWYKEYIDYVATYGLMNGMGDDTFAPTITLSRAMFVQILANLSGVDTSNSDVGTQFKDVPAGKWFTPAVKWAADNKIVNGISPTEFKPSDPVQRQQMCAMLVRYTEYANITLTTDIEKAQFGDDARIQDYAKEAVYACQQAGIIDGMDKETNTFAPRESATRAQVAAIMSRFHKISSVK